MTSLARVFALSGLLLVSDTIPGGAENTENLSGPEAPGAASPPAFPPTTPSIAGPVKGCYRTEKDQIPHTIVFHVNIKRSDDPMSISQGSPEANPLQPYIAPLEDLLPAFFNKETQGASVEMMTLSAQNGIREKIDRSFSIMSEALGKTVGFPLKTEWHILGIAPGCSPEQLPPVRVSWRLDPP